MGWKCRLMFLVKGIQMNAKHIHKNKLLKAWRTMSSRQMPKIKALKLSDEDFNHFIDVRRCPEDQMREMEEWGRILSTRGTDACVYHADPADDAEFIILIRPVHNSFFIVLLTTNLMSRSGLES